MAACSPTKPSTPPQTPPLEHAATLDTTRLYPLIVPTGYLAASPMIATPGFSAGDHAIRRPLLEDLEVTLVIDHPGQPNEHGVATGMAQYINQATLSANKLTEDEAFRLALENLTRAAEQGDLRPQGVKDDDGRIHLVRFSDHWLAASALLLPGMQALAAKQLGTDQVIATIPHRDVMAIFADKSPSYRAATAKLIFETDGEGRKPITRRLIRLAPCSRLPFHEAPVGAFVD